LITIVAGGGLSPANGEPASSTPRITVGHNVQVSKARGQAIHNEVLLAADPRNPAHLLGCSKLS
jgi:hypothetical protein